MLVRMTSMTIMMLMLLLVHAEDNDGDDDNYDDINDNDMLVSCYLPGAPTRKVSRFMGFPNKTFKNERKTEAKQTTKTTIFATLTQKNTPKKAKQTHRKRGRTIL